MTTSTDLAVRNGTAALAIQPYQEMFTDKQRAALAVLGIKDASNADLAVYMHYCQKTGLDPFSRQIYMIARREKQGDQWVTKQSIQVGIDGFRVIRDRIARREGLTIEYGETIWYDASGGEHKVWLWDEAPAACRVDVYKNGQLFPGVVRTAAYMATKDGKPVGQWRTQPDHMIEKCAEAYALRRAFPHDLGGIYLDDEMPPPAVPAQARHERVTAAEIVSSTQNGHHEPAPAQDGPPEPKTGQPAPKAMALKLDKLLQSLPLGPEADVKALLEWLCGGEYTATRSQVQLVTPFFEDHLAKAEGDVTEAAAAIWEQHRAATGQDAAAEPEPGGGDAD